MASVADTALNHHSLIIICVILFNNTFIIPIDIQAGQLTYYTLMPFSYQ